MVKGFDLSVSRAPGWDRSMMMSGRDFTSRPRERITTRRLSEGETVRGVPVPRPREAFHLLRDSSWASRGERCC